MAAVFLSSSPERMSEIVPQKGKILPAKSISYHFLMGISIPILLAFEVKFGIFSKKCCEI